jgi:beta-glucanase (GH16 family)
LGINKIALSEQDRPAFVSGNFATLVNRLPFGFNPPPMRLWLLPTLALAAAVLPAGSAAAPNDWQLVWSDDFNGPRLDFTKWAVEENAHGGGNNELQFYTDRPQNVRVENGHLILEARKEPHAQSGVTRDYTSGRIRTKHRADWTYARVEIRAKVPKGRGLWPALWMLPTEEKYGGWAASGEIDIMELIGHEPHQVHGTLHFGGKWPRQKSAGKPFALKKGTFADDFHTFSLEWEKDAFRWSVDGELFHTATQWHSEGAPFPAPFDQPFHLVLNLAVGGNWPGPPHATTEFPARLLVDYVRVYQRKP